MTAFAKRSWFPIVVAAIWLLAAARLAWLYMQTGGVLGWDFRIYTTAVASAASGIDPYKAGEIGTGFINHPGLLLLVYPLARFGEAGVLVWIAGLIAGWAATLRVAAAEGTLRVVEGKGTLKVPPDRSPDIRLLLVLLPLTAAVEGIFMGQASIPAGLCLAAAYAALRRDRDVLAGALIGMGVMFKLSLAVFGLYFLLKKRLRAVAALAVGFAIFTLAAEWLLFRGISGVFLETMAGLYAEHHPGVHNNSLAGLPFFPLISLALLAAIALAILRTKDRSGSPLAFGGLAAWTLLVSPLTWHHHYVLLVVPIAALFAIRRGGHKGRAGPYARPYIGIALALLIQLDLPAIALGLPVHTALPAAIGVLLLSQVPLDKYI